MEATLQVKQAGNPSFGFLARRHPLHAFYKHVRQLMQTGQYEYAEDVRKREEATSANSEEKKASTSADTPSRTTVNITEKHG